MTIDLYTCIQFTSFEMHFARSVKSEKVMEIQTYPYLLIVSSHQVLSSLFFDKVHLKPETIRQVLSFAIGAMKFKQSSVR